MDATAALRRTVAVVAALNLLYFGVESAVALSIGSVSLFADSVDFLEDAAVDFLVFLALAWGARNRSRLGKGLAVMLLLPVAGFAYALWMKVQAPVPPDPTPLGLTGLGALAVNLLCAILLVRYRRHPGGLVRAAFLSARNDVLANVAIVVVGVVTLASPSIWPDIVVGLGIAVMNAGAAKEVWEAAKAEGQEEEAAKLAAQA